MNKIQVQGELALTFHCVNFGRKIERKSKSVIRKLAQCKVSLHSPATANILREIDRKHQSESAEIYQVQGELALTPICR